MAYSNDTKPSLQTLTTGLPIGLLLSLTYTITGSGSFSNDSVPAAGSFSNDSEPSAGSYSNDTKPS